MAPTMLSEIGQLVLGAYAMADSHSLSAAAVDAMSNGMLNLDQIESAMGELTAAGYAEQLESSEFRLTREGIELTLQLQTALGDRFHPVRSRKSDIL